MATWLVDASGGGDFTSIQYAIDAASDGDTIEVSGGMYDEWINFGGKSIAVIAVGSATINTNGIASWAVTFEGGETAAAELTGFNIKNEGGGGVYVGAASPTLSELYIYQASVGVQVAGGAPSLTDLELYGLDEALQVVGGSATLTRLSVTEGGWGVVAWGGAAIVVEDSAFEENSAGALALDRSTGSITGSAFIHNSGGGAIALTDGATLEVVQSSFERNLPYDVYNLRSTLTMTECSSDGSSGGMEGGALTLWNGTATLDQCSFTNNVGAVAGAVWGQGATVTITNSTFSHGESIANGGFVAFNGGTLDVRDTSFEDGQAGGSGGAIHADGAEVLLAGAEFTSNHADEDGGAVHIVNAPTLSVSDTTIANNSAGKGGGGLYTRDAQTTAYVATTAFSKNAAAGEGGEGGGGSIYAAGADLEVSHSTFADGSAHEGGGSVSMASGGGLAVAESSFTSVEGEAVIWADGGADHGVSVMSSTFTDNDATPVYVETGAAAVISDCAFEGNVGSRGGGIHLGNVALHTLVADSFCDNLALEGGAVWVGAGVGQWSSLVAQETVASGSGGGFYVSGATVALANVTIAGASADAGGAFYVASGSVAITNGIVAFTRAGDGVRTESGAFSATYTDAWLNVDTDGFTPTWAVDPLFVDLDVNGDCEDDLGLSRGSTLRDAGAPDLLDADGSPSDVGAYGGPDTPRSDADRDGAYDDVDCDDTDPDVYPSAEETWYDGVDQDCDGNDDDQDGDGLAVADDCDDTDALVGACDSGSPDDTGSDTGSSPAPSGGLDSAEDDDSPTITCACATQNRALGPVPWMLCVAGVAAVKRRGRVRSPA